MSFPSLPAFASVLAAFLLTGCVEAPPSDVTDIQQWMEESARG